MSNPEPNTVVRHAAGILMALTVVFSHSAFAAQSPTGTDKAVASSKPAARADAEERTDAILSELRQIRQLLEQQQAQLARAMAPQPPAAPLPPEKVVMSVGSGWHSIGRLDAPVTLVEFADYQCPFCRRFHTDAYAELKKQYIDTGKVRFVSRDLPLDFHPFALKAAEAARCAGDQGKYWEMRDALYLNAGPPNDEALKKAGEVLSLDSRSFQACLSSERHRADVQKDVADAAALRLNGTPSFVLGRATNDKLDGLVLVGALPFASFDAAIRRLLQVDSAGQ